MKGLPRRGHGAVLSLAAPGYVHGWHGAGVHRDDDADRQLAGGPCAGLA